MWWTVCAALLASASGAHVYPKSESIASRFFAVVDQGRSAEELLCLDALAGNLARKEPQIYRVHSEDWEHDAGDAYSVYLQYLQGTLKVPVNNSFLTASLANIVQEFIGELSGYIRCGSGDTSTSAALTLAAASNGLLIAASDAVAAALDSLGLAQVRDVRGKRVSDVLNEALPTLSKKIFVFQDASKMGNLGDYAVFARAPMMAFGSDAKAQATILGRSDELAVAFGWGPENEYVSTLNQHGVYVHASDWSKNLAALGNVQWQTAKPPLAIESHYNYSAAVHTVSFLMSDGDNIQWTLGGWSTNEKWWGSSQRGAVPLGWTFSPATKWLAPTMLQQLLTNSTNNDELVAGPSGVGYMYPSQWPSETLKNFTSLTFEGMKFAGMKSINIIGKGDNAPDLNLMEHFIADDTVDGMMYYSFGGGYSGLGGAVWSAGGKPVVSGRYSLWGEATSGPMLGVDALVKHLKALPKDDARVDGYSLIPVHAWSHTYADVVDVVNKLTAAGGFDIVLPSELLRRLRNLPSDMCYCTNKDQATPHNGFTCTDASKSAYCADDEVCMATSSWSYPSSGDWTGICGKPEITCSCSKVGQSMPNNGYTCSDSSKNAYCTSTQKCMASEFAYPRDGDWSGICVDAILLEKNASKPAANTSLASVQALIV